MNITIDTTSVSLGNYIRKIRIDKGYSQYFMAHALAISQNSYCLLENGQTKFNFDRLLQIAIIFKLEPQDFLNGYFNGIEG
ncbi:helix-turn-helix domain-containing protein [Pedobacter sp. MC2016-24]|uniref:helix-turn-helix domain-containing protein n=1 Tax=Pedobacter sp. MC2016-24 TaxID=2780090 RepID=UPI001882E4AF|nr:helix-turn-helix transcriptional regulator [Pedobacter sp. MC2016-24]MBE9598997.1 helix-turn-helix transcriptional regulator [Pedobacter sp. MC2016-24]